VNILVSVLAVIAISPPGIDFEPGFNWFTLETENFSIHFPEREVLQRERLEYIKKIALLAEDVRMLLKANSVVVPAGKVQIVVADYYDYYNGYATPFPDNTIALMPHISGASRINDDDWLRTLILHEFSHICQIDQCRGFPLLLRSIFGRIILPNSHLPAWLLEGYAVYNETRFSSFGRLRSAEWQARLKTALHNQRILTIDRCNHYGLQRYPGGLAPYLYGGKLIEFVANRYGDSIWEVFNCKNSRQVPFFENIAAKRSFGRSFNRLWQEWQEELKKQADSIRKLIPQEGMSNFQRITYEGFYTSSPVWSVNGAEIYYISANDREQRSIKAVNLTTMRRRIVHRGAVFGNMSVSRNSRYLAFSELVSKGLQYEQGDIFILDLNAGSLRRLTYDERAYDPDFSPNDSLLVYVSNSNGKSRLMIINYPTGEKQVLSEIEDGYYYHPRFSPGGKLIAVGVWREGGCADLEVIDFKTGWSFPITQDRANDINPCWSRDGRLLFFASDCGMVYNIYAYDIENNETYRCTNSEFGLLEPAVSPDNDRLALIALGSDGYDVNIAKINPKDWCRADGFVDEFPHLEYKFLNPAPFQLYYYSPFPTVLPKFWLPWLVVDRDFEVGIFTLGWDVLRFHRYWAVAGIRLDEEKPFLNFVYEFHRYRPFWNLTALLMPDRQNVRIGVQLPYYRVKYSQTLGLGSRLVVGNCFRWIIDGSYHFNNARKFRFGVAPVQGRNLGILFDLRGRSFSFGYDLLRVAGYWNEYIGMPPANWSLGSRLAIGTSFGDTGRFSAFTITDQSTIFRVRGYGDSTITTANVIGAGILFRIPIVWLERGWGTLPIFIQNLNTAFFCDAAAHTQNFFQGLSGYRIGTGMEVRLDVLIAHYLPGSLTVGIAVGHNRIRNPQVYFSIQSDLLASIRTFTNRDNFYLPPE